MRFAPGPAAPATRATGDSASDVELARIKDALDRLASSELVQGHVLYRVRLKAAARTLVEHGLGVAPRSWEACGLRQGAVVWQPGEATDKHLPLQSSVDCTCDVKVW